MTWILRSVGYVLTSLLLYTLLQSSIDSYHRFEPRTESVQSLIYAQGRYTVLIGFPYLVTQNLTWEAPQFHPLELSQHLRYHLRTLYFDPLNDREYYHLAPNDWAMVLYSSLVILLVQIVLIEFLPAPRSLGLSVAPQREPRPSAVKSLWLGE